MKPTFPALLAALLLPLAASAADDDSLVEVFAVGSGLTQDAAMKAANKAAVEQVVGTMVDATTRIENDELVEDRILTYSAALIADSKIVGAPKTVDGLITVKVKATVKKTALKEKLVAAKILEVELDGESLWAQAISAQDNLADAEAMIADVLAKHLACVVAEQIPGKNGKSPIDYDPKTGEVFANVRVRIDMAKYAQFAKEVLDKLGPMAERIVGVQGVDKKGNSRIKNIRFGFPSDAQLQNGLLVLLSPCNTKAKVLVLDKNQGAAVAKSLDTGSVAVSARVLDQFGEEIANHSVSVDSRDKHGHSSVYGLSVFGLNEDSREGATLGYVAPCFGGDVMWSGFSRSEGVTSAVIRETFGGPMVAEKQLRIPLGTFTPDELKTAGKLEIRVGHMKDGRFVE